MKRLTYCTFLLLIFFAISCTSPQPKGNELFGTWSASDGGTMVLSPDGSLSADSVPTAQFIGMYENPARFNGTGSWSVAEHNGRWCVDLKFTSLSFRSGSWMNSLIIDRRQEGVVLFTWISDEGGARYEMSPAPADL